MRWAAGGRDVVRASAAASPVRRAAVPMSLLVTALLVFSGGSARAVERPGDTPRETPAGVAGAPVGTAAPSAAPAPGQVSAPPTGFTAAYPAGPADLPSTSSRPPSSAPVVDDGFAAPRLPLPFSVLDWLRSTPSPLSSPPSPPAASPPAAGWTVPPGHASHEPGDGPLPEDPGPGPLRPPAPARPDVHGQVGQRPDPGRRMDGPRASAGPRGWPPEPGGGAGVTPSLVPSEQSGGAASPESAPTAGGPGDEQRPTSSPDPGRPEMRVLPLGAGMLLVGLGLGFLGLRLRRR